MNRYAKQRSKKSGKPWTRDQLNAWILFNKKNTMSDSIWDRDEIVNEKEDNSNSMFLNKALGDGDSMKLKFIDVFHQDQRKETPDIYKTEDGKEWVLYFEDEAGNERQMSQRSTKGKLFQALRAKNVEPNMWVTVTRKGLELDTEYVVTLDGEVEYVPEPEEKTEDIPF